MSSRIFLLLLIPTVVSISSISAEEPPSLLLEGGMPSILATRDVFRIYVEDQVDDDCLPQPNQLADKLEITLRQNDFSIANDDSTVASSILINPIGYEVTEYTCVVSLTIVLNFWTEITVPYTQDRNNGTTTFAPINHIVATYLLSGRKSSMQARLEDKVSDSGEDLFLTIDRGRDTLRNNFPEILEEYESTTGKSLD